MYTELAEKLFSSFSRQEKSFGVVLAAIMLLGISITAWATCPTGTTSKKITGGGACQFDHVDCYVASGVTTCQSDTTYKCTNGPQDISDGLGGCPASGSNTLACHASTANFTVNRYSVSPCSYDTSGHASGTCAAVNPYQASAPYGYDSGTCPGG